MSSCITKRMEERRFLCLRLRRLRQRKQTLRPLLMPLPGNKRACNQGSQPPQQYLRK